MSASIEMNGVFYQNVYYMAVSKGFAVDSKGRYEIKDPPCSGWSHALVIWPDDNEEVPEESKRRKRPAKRVTLFCPYTLEAYQISPGAREVAHQEAYPLTEDLIDRLAAIIDRNWKMYSGFGHQKAYDVAALVLTRLGRAVPSYMSPALENLEYTETEVPNRHGKPVGEALLRLVNRSSKRGQVCEFFINAEAGSIREAMAKFDMSRSGVLTHLHGLHKDHGLGYVLQGDVATIMLPPGCDNPLVDEAEAREITTTTSAQKAGKPCKPTVSKLPEKGKRREVALAMLTEMAIADVAEKIGCSINSVRSHLHDLHTKHGFGYELSPDKSRGKLIVPSGWTADYDPDELDPLA
jgi:hypothetical protein